MKHVNVKGMDMSVFTLGTVQLGMDYGLGEHTQKPPKEAAFALLDRAAACGVNAIDTANIFGDSERTIGEWLRMKRPEDRPYVITKIGPFDQNTKECLRDDIFRQTEKSLQTLNADTLDMLMVDVMISICPAVTHLHQTGRRVSPWYRYTRMAYCLEGTLRTY